MDGNTVSTVTIADKRLIISTQTGVVADSQKWSETHVSSSNGGGYVSREGGYISAPTINSSSSTKHEFWLELEDGTEKPIRLSDVDIPLRVGQKITMISIKLVDKIDEYWCALYNHTAKEYHEIHSPTLCAISLFDLSVKSPVQNIPLRALGVFCLSWIIVLGLLNIGGRALSDAAPIFASIFAGVFAAIWFFHRLTKLFQNGKKAKQYGSEIEKSIVRVVNELRHSQPSPTNIHESQNA